MSNASFNRRRLKPGNGSRLRSSSVKRIPCQFDDQTFSQIRDRAEKEQTSFAEQVRQLVEFGLEADAAAEVAR